MWMRAAGVRIDKRLRRRCSCRAACIKQLLDSPQYWQYRLFRGDMRVTQ